MASSPTTEKVIPYALLGVTAVTGLVDAVSFSFARARLHCKHDGEYRASRVCNGAGIRTVHARSLTALLAFLVGAVVGGRVMARTNADSQIRLGAQAFLLEVAFLLAASFCGTGYRADLLEDSFQPFALIALTALAMGTRNAAVRKLAIPDLTTTVLTLTITGIGADSSLPNGNNPRLARRVGAVAAMFLGGALGAVVTHYSISVALWLATAISAVCSAALFRSVYTFDKL
jgi:uncharacterized membrane protein YoaK (UPF0700 family)